MHEHYRVMSYVKCGSMGDRYFSLNFKNNVIADCEFDGRMVHFKPRTALKDAYNKHCTSLIDFEFCCACKDDAKALSSTTVKDREGAKISPSF